MLRVGAENGERATTGRPGKTSHDVTFSAPTLSDIGISKNQSSRWQKLADMPDEHFETAVETAMARRAECRGRGRPHRAWRFWPWAGRSAPPRGPGGCTGSPGVARAWVAVDAQLLEEIHREEVCLDWSPAAVGGATLAVVVSPAAGRLKSA